jgi:hypothetical protein
MVQQGKEIFDKSCATGYCHGPGGLTAGGAPRLAARGFDEAYIDRVVSNGLPGTAMPGFAGSFQRREVVEVIAYVATLNGLSRRRRCGGRVFAQPPRAASCFRIPSDAPRGAPHAMKLGALEFQSRRRSRASPPMYRPCKR